MMIQHPKGDYFLCLEGAEVEYGQEWPTSRDAECFADVHPGAIVMRWYPAPGRELPKAHHAPEEISAILGTEYRWDDQHSVLDGGGLADNGGHHSYESYGAQVMVLVTTSGAVADQVAPLISAWLGSAVRGGTSHHRCRAWARWAIDGARGG